MRVLFEVTCSTDLALIGAYPQASFYEIVGHERPYDDLWARRRFRDVLDASVLSMRGALQTDARPTDVLSCSEISPGWGLVMEPSVIDRIAPYLPASTTRHPFALDHGTYQYLEVRETAELLDHIEFARSSFCT